MTDPNETDSLRPKLTVEPADESREKFIAAAGNDAKFS
jgi:hypothetical protein